MTNCRGLSITSIQSKLLEHISICKSPHLRQSDLQFGFTLGCTPVMASYCLTELLYEAEGSKEQTLEVSQLTIEG